MEISTKDSAGEGVVTIPDLSGEKEKAAEPQDFAAVVEDITPDEGYLGVSNGNPADFEEDAEADYGIDLAPDVEAESSVELLSEGSSENAEENPSLEPVEQSLADEAGPEDDENPELRVVTETVHSDRKDEIPALLGTRDAAEDETLITVPDEDVESEDVSSKDSPVALGEDVEEKTVEAESATETLNEAENDEQMTHIIIPPEPAVPVQQAPDQGYQMLFEALRESAATMQQVSSKIDEISTDTECIINQVNLLSSKYELFAMEMDATSSNNNTKSVLSKSYLILSSVVVALLVIYQVYSFTSLLRIQNLQNAAGASAFENITSLNNKMAQFDKNLAKLLEKPVQQEPAQLKPVAAEVAHHETAVNDEVGSVGLIPVLEKLNKLRNGLPEKKLIRKETGDWFVVNKKNEECISDVDIIEVLNQAYKRIGRSLSPDLPVPPHNAVCLLKADGKGRTTVVMTKEILP